MPPSGGSWLKSDLQSLTHDCQVVNSTENSRVCRFARRIYTTEIVLLFSRRQDEIGRHTSELQSHRDLHSFPTRRSSDLHDCQVVNSTENSRVCRFARRIYTTEIVLLFSRRQD